MAVSNLYFKKSISLLQEGRLFIPRTAILFATYGTSISLTYGWGTTQVETILFATPSSKKCVAPLKSPTLSSFQPMSIYFQIASIGNSAGLELYSIFLSDEGEIS